MFLDLVGNPLANRISGAKSIAFTGLSRVPLKRPKPAFDPLLTELPQHLDLMAARLQNGENIYSVLADQALASGQLAVGFRRLATRLSLGETLDSALDHLTRELKSELVQELANKVKFGLVRGTPLAGQFLLLSASAKNQLKVAQLRAAGRNELRMLIPLVFLILPVTIAFAIFPSLQILQLGV
jgi:tight adherence protein C